ncbi:glycosyltransferase family 4 protein [Pseudoalteromonas piscicida]
MKRKNIIVSPSSVFGGGENFIVTLAELCPEIDFTVFCLNKNLYSKLSSHKNVNPLLFKGKLHLVWFVFKALFSRGRSLYFNGLSESRFLYLLTYFCNFTVFSHSAEEWGGEFDKGFIRKFRSQLNRLLLNKKSRRIITVCDYSRKNLQKQLPEARITLIYNTSMLPSKLKESRESSEVTFGFVGRLATEKGIDFLLRSIQLLQGRPRVLNFKFVIAGEGPLKAGMESYAKQAGLRNIEFLGHIEASKVFKQIDCLILPSKTEACPLVILESMSLGMPVIATKVGGVPELIEDGESGFLIQSGNEQELVSAMLNIIENDRFKSMSSSAKSLYSKSFNNVIFKNKYVEVFSND